MVLILNLEDCPVRATMRLIMSLVAAGMLCTSRVVAQATPRPTTARHGAAPEPAQTTSGMKATNMMATTIHAAMNSGDNSTMFLDALLM